MSNSTRPHDCRNRERKLFYYAFDGYTDDTRQVAKVVKVYDSTTHDCQYSKRTTNDPRCAGCWRKASA